MDESYFNAESMPVLRSDKQVSKHKDFENYVIFDNTDSLVAIISKDLNCTYIYRPQQGLESKSLNYLELLFAIPLAVKINSIAYRLDEWPIPEITHHYKDVRQPGTSVF